MTKPEIDPKLETGSIDLDQVEELDVASNDIYEIVDALVGRTDDPSLPALTFRVWFLGLFWCLLLSVPTTLASFRTNPFTVSAGIATIISYPMGVFMAWVLPNKNISLGPFSFNLNPGKFNIKEHALIYIWASTGTSQPYAILNIIGQKYLLYQEDLPLWGSVLFMIATQCFGFGLAGVCRRYLVRPAAMLWPTCFSTIALLNSFHESGVDNSGYKMTRFKFFWIACASMAIYQIFPSFVAPILGSICVLCYIAPMTSNPDITRVLGSGINGFGMLGLSFDWSQININGPITSPFWALLNNYIGAYVLVWVISPILWSTNAFGDDKILGTNPASGANGTGENVLGYAVNTPSLYNKAGDTLEAFKFVNRSTLVLDTVYYDEHKPIYITTFFAVNYMQSFLVFTAVFTHIGLWYAKDIYTRFKAAMKELDSDDIHARMMDVYPEVSEFWYMAVLVVNLIFAFSACIWGGFNLEWWGVLLAFLLALVSVLPIGIIMAISGQVIGINVISEFMIGLMIPGEMIGVMTFKTFSYNAMSQALNLVSDLKLGHYMKIPPRAMFISQFVAAVVAGIFQLFLATGLVESFGRSSEYVIDPLKPEKGYQWQLWVHPPPGYKSTGFNTFTNAGAIWGAIGPARFFGPGSPYCSTLWGFLIGAILPVIPWALHKRYPNSFWHLVNIPVIFAPTTSAGYSNSILITPLLVGFIVNHVIKSYRAAWWKKYAYTLSAALDAGAVFGVLIVFAAFQMNSQYAIVMKPYFGYPADGEHCAPDFYLNCAMDQIQGLAFGANASLFEPSEYCKSINFGGLAN